MKEINVILLSLFFIFASFGLSSATMYTIQDQGYCSWSSSHFDVRTLEWNPQSRTWSQATPFGNDMTSGSIGTIVSSDGTSGEKVNVTITYNYQTTWRPDGSFAINSGNYLSADHLDILGNYSAGMGGSKAFYESTPFSGGATGSITITFEAETGSILSEGTRASGKHDDIAISGIHLVDDSLQTRVGFYINTTIYRSNYSITPVPEPATMLLLGLGLIGVARIRKKIC